jgi:hypothetical protein
MVDEKQRPTFDEILSTIEPYFSQPAIIAGLLVDKNLPDLSSILDLKKEELLTSVVSDLSDILDSFKRHLADMDPPKTPQRKFQPTKVKLSSPAVENIPVSQEQFSIACECSSNLYLFNKEKKKLQKILNSSDGETTTPGELSKVFAALELYNRSHRPATIFCYYRIIAKVLAVCSETFQKRLKKVFKMFLKRLQHDSEWKHPPFCTLSEKFLKTFRCDSKQESQSVPETAPVQNKFINVF